MANLKLHRNWIFRIGRSAAGAALVLTIVLVLTVVANQSAQAQTYTVIHNFTGPDGAYPEAGLSKDRAGNFYGTTKAGGNGSCTVDGQSGCGTVFKLTQKNSNWLLAPLYSFQGGSSDGAAPSLGTLTIATDGSLYGATVAGGPGGCQSYGATGCGTVFNLRPAMSAPKSALSPWKEKVLYMFTGGSDGSQAIGSPIFDESGNLYGPAGSYPSCGDIYKLTPSGGSWTFSVAYAFTCPPDGQIPIGQLTLDKAGNLWGTTWDGGTYGEGTVYELTPSGGGWAETVIHSFQDSEGDHPESGVIFDVSGNVYGGTPYNGPSGSGIAYELVESMNWSLTTLTSFSGPNECGVYNFLTMDSAGNLYGTTACDGKYGFGNVWELIYPNWTYKDLYDFTAGTDGGYPYSNIVFDGAGNLYGTAKIGGTGQGCSSGCGVVWKITP